MREADPRNPLHRASFWLERLKYGPQGGVRGILTAQGVHASDAQWEMLLREANLGCTAAELREGCEYYGESYAVQIPGLPELVARSIFYDGVQHGIALAAGLEADPPS